ncbi:alpha/beta hydrolase family protein [Tundrisphaera sp. TA3]|uniref:alpha/beta hydrolase family protein n=1 Tax=Tundrisphaera sp. TA3 TaxID=3435775 RepID=UPI003EBC9BBB
MKPHAFPILLGLLLIPIPLRAQAPPPLPPAAEIRARFLKDLDRPRVPLDPREEDVPATGSEFARQSVSFASEAHPDGSIERVPALVVKPRDGADRGRRPAVIALHGTGGNKEGMKPWLEELASRGFLVMALDGRYHGERAGGRPGTEAYNDAIVRAWRAKPDEPATHPLYYDTVWDVWRAVDYLQARPDVDPDRIGLMGISKGGIETWLAASADDRIKVAVPAIAMQSFRWGLDHDRWKARANTVRAAHEAVARERGEPEVTRDTCLALWPKILPGILDVYDGPSLVRLFAGRPLLIVNGENDPNCPIEGAEIAFASAREAFHAAGADDRLKIMVAPKVGHVVTPEQHRAILDWFTAWLKPTPPGGNSAPGQGL